MQGRPALQFKPRPAETIAKAAVEGLDVFLVAGDFSKSADVIRVVDETARHFGRLDGLINNAGGMLGRVPYAEMTDEQYDKVMDLNARSVVTACRAALPWLKKQGGFIVNDGRPASAQWRRRRRRHLRLGEVLVSNITRGMAKEWVADKIRVNAVAPGYIDTPFHDRYSQPQHVTAMAADPDGRAATPEECVGAYLFLSSDAMSGYITGQVIEVNGGQLMP
jgi:3-oxoacyl-[acyl-carrier protein] reductase